MRPAYQENLCHDCARFRGGRDRGEADAALSTLGFAVFCAQRAGVTADQLREALEMILTEKTSSIGMYTEGCDGVLPSDFREDHPWQWSGSWARLLNWEVA